MQSAVKNSVLTLLVVAVLATTACRRDMRNQNPDTPPPPVYDSATPATPAAPSTTSTADHAEVFRRAFWRHPTTADRILHAERRVNSTESGETWSWFIQLHPSPELLAALRAPDTFGLLALPPDVAPRAWPDRPPPPTWFPSSDSLMAYEVLQAPSANLTLLFDRTTGLLHATDHGGGFSPARP